VIEAVEDEEANANEAATSPTEDTLDPDTFKPYEDEPMASEDLVFCVQNCKFPKISLSVNFHKNYRKK